MNCRFICKVAPIRGNAGAFAGFHGGDIRALVNSFPGRSKKATPQISRSMKYLQRDEIKKVLGYNKQEGKIHGIQSKQESEQHRSRDSLV